MVDSKASFIALSNTNAIQSTFRLQQLLLPTAHVSSK